MIDRICISINNRCNLACSYCHFHEKGKIEAAEMDVYEILNNVKKYAEKKRPEKGFKIGFVGNGECFLDWQALKSYIAYLEDAPGVRIYTITNGTVRLPEEDLAFLEEHRVNVGFSIDGYRELHDKYRCNSFDRAMENVERYRQMNLQRHCGQGKPEKRGRGDFLFPAFWNQSDLFPDDWEIWDFPGGIPGFHGQGGKGASGQAGRIGLYDVRRPVRGGYE